MKHEDDLCAAVRDVASAIREARELSLEDEAWLQWLLTVSEQTTKRLELVARHLKALDQQTS